MTDSNCNERSLKVERRSIGNSTWAGYNNVRWKTKMSLQSVHNFKYGLLFSSVGIAS